MPVLLAQQAKQGIVVHPVRLPRHELREGLLHLAVIVQAAAGGLQRQLVIAQGGGIPVAQQAAIAQPADTDEAGIAGVNGKPRVG